MTIKVTDEAVRAALEAQQADVTRHARENVHAPLTQEEKERAMRAAIEAAVKFIHVDTW